MISRTIYFIDRWIRLNLQSAAHAELADPKQLVSRCVHDAAKLGISAAELEQDLGTDLLDFISHELASVELTEGTQ